ncbi:MAG: hypothetical protein EBU08_21685, partial [Micrococcales bacterium]|nr:hypothetical protein [Micrococcales bacterium]
MAMPTLGVAVDFANGPAFGNPLILDDASTPLGVGILADSPSDVVDVSDITLRASIRRGRNRILNKFEAGTATVVLEDTNGDWVPTNTASPYYGKLVPLRKIRIWADYNSVRYYLYSGYITSYDTNFQVGVESVSSVTLQCVDAFRLFSNISISTVAGTSAGQTTGARMNNLLDVPDFPLSQRAIDTGDSTVQADPGTERDLLNALQTIENSEFGGFYIDPEGNATFLSRNTLAQKADQTATDFADDGTGISYQTIDFAYDDTLIFNDVTVNRVGGIAQTVQDTSSIETYFIHSGKREGLLVQTDTESFDQATMILQSRKDAIFRIDSIGLNLADDAETARIQAGLELDIFDLVNITKS